MFTKRRRLPGHQFNLKKAVEVGGFFSPATSVGFYVFWALTCTVHVHMIYAVLASKVTL